MSRRFFLIAFGVLVGYSMGYKDARAHDKPWYERVVDRVGGAARGKYGGDVDRATAAVER